METKPFLNVMVNRYLGDPFKWNYVYSWTGVNSLARRCVYASENYSNIAPYKGFVSGHYKTVIWFNVTTHAEPTRPGMNNIRDFKVNQTMNTTKRNHREMTILYILETLRINSHGVGAVTKPVRQRRHGVYVQCHSCHKTGHRPNTAVLTNFVRHLAMIGLPTTKSLIAVSQ